MTTPTTIIKKGQPGNVTELASSEVHAPKESLQKLSNGWLMPFLRTGKMVLLKTAQKCGAFHLAYSSKWRKQRLLILCYHGISLDDEHRWLPGLFLSRERFLERLQLLQKSRCNVLSLSEGLERLRAGTLPERSVVITFDDGFENFHSVALPLLQQFDFAATVYASTNYTERPLPVFPLILSYLAWRKRGTRQAGWKTAGLPEVLDLGSGQSREECVAAIQQYADQQQLDLEERDRLAAEFATHLGEDYERLREMRLLQTMNPEEIVTCAAAGIDIQLHTHSHELPDDPGAFAEELRVNRTMIETCTQAPASHFCYPSGRFSEQCVRWLREMKVGSGVTCEPGLASVGDDLLLLPRYLDGEGRSAIEFEGWLSGIASFFPANRKPCT